MSDPGVGVKDGCRGVVWRVSEVLTPESRLVPLTYTNITHGQHTVRGRTATIITTVSACEEVTGTHRQTVPRRFSLSYVPVRATEYGH